MQEIRTYLLDGAGAQARATLMLLQGLGNIDESWDTESKTYLAVVNVARWENYREQGYIVSLFNKKHEQLNIAFFEHRNSDNICAVKWKQLSLNSLTIETASMGDVYKDKYDVSHSVGHGKCLEMAKWIKDELTKHYVEE